MKKVALLIETSNSYARGLMRGIAAYQREHERWSLYLSEGLRGGAVPAWLRGWTGEGVIARIENAQIAQAVKRVTVPVVDLSSARLVRGLPWVETDDERIAGMAAEHLLGLGLTRFAFCGDRSFNWSVWRERYFEQAIRAAGRECRVLDVAHVRSSSASSGSEPLAKWIAELARPVGIFACDDSLGRQVLEACRTASVAVPDEVAVLGVDDDEVICELSDPPLSSVIPNTHLTGYTAAAILSRLMEGEAVSPDALLIPPLGIAARRSTDVLAVEDPNTAASLRFIRANACKGICVKDVLRAVPQSRRLLESRFRELLGRSPHEEITRVRMERVKSLLVQTELPLARIAELTGFAYAEYLAAAFRREEGVPPGRYRQRSRSRSRRRERS